MQYGHPGRSTPRKSDVAMEVLMTGSAFQPLAYRRGSFYLLLFNFWFCLLSLFLALITSSV